MKHLPYSWLPPRTRDISQLYSYLSLVPGPWCTYRNPMRSDGVFVGQDREIAPHAGQNGWRAVDETDPYRRSDGLSYPATPQGAVGLAVQLPHDMAERLVAMLNKRVL